MKTGIFYGPHDIRVEEVPDPKIEKSTDAIIKIIYVVTNVNDALFSILA